MPGQSGGHGLLLLCEAELGQPMYEIMTSDPDAGTAAKKAGCIATKGLGRTVPMGWVDAGCIHESLNGVLMVHFLEHYMPDSFSIRGRETD